MLVTFLPEDHDSAITDSAIIATGHPPDGIPPDSHHPGASLAALIAIHHALQGKYR
jgi:hypothetical protein